MNIFYIHGFNSGPNSSTGKLLKKEFPEHNVIILSYDSSKSSEENFKNLVKEFEKFEHEDDDLIVGTSLGGYYGCLLSNHFSVSSVLVNPAYNPKKTLMEFVGENTSFEDGHKYVLTEEVVKSYKDLNTIKYDRVPRIVIIGNNDPVIDPNENKKFWKDCSNVIVTNDEHSIKTFLPYKKEIEEVSRTVVL